MSKTPGRTQILAALAVFSAAGLFADPVQIVRYDISDAMISGFGFWGHTYSGTITPGSPISNSGATGTTGSYSGGSGTLNDGVIGTRVSTTQLFLEGTPDVLGPAVHPEITLFLNGFYRINSISIFGGDIDGNAIPGCISGVTASIGGSSAAITTTAFGTGTPCPSNDLATITGTALAGLVTNQIRLSTFVLPVSADRFFSITEIQVDGVPASPEVVPEPGSMTLAALGLCGLAVWRRQQHRRRG